MKLRTGFVSNSSSSCFVCKTNMSLKKVKEKLTKIYELSKELLGKNCAFEDVFNNPFYGSNEYDVELERGDYLKRLGAKGTTKKKVIIESASDNSIPYQLFELIESIFNGARIHLG